MRMMVMMLGCAVVVLAACGSEASTQSEPIPEIPVMSEADRAEAARRADAEAGPVVEEGNFELRAEAAGPYAPGETGTFGVALLPKSGWHVNEEYPMQIDIEAPASIQVEQASMGRDEAAEFAEERARFDVRFTPSEAGEHRVLARVDFAVCTPENCVPDQRTLALVLPVE